MSRQLRDLSKLYKFANDNNIVIEEVDKFKNSNALGMYCGRFDYDMLDPDPDSPKDIYIKIKRGLNPAHRLAVIAHEIGHDTHGFEYSFWVNNELEAWDTGEKLLKQLGIRVTNTFYKYRRQHLGPIEIARKIAQHNCEKEHHELAERI